MTAGPLAERVAGYATYIRWIRSAYPDRVAVAGSWRSIGTELLVLGGGLFAIVLFIVGAITGLWRRVRQIPRRR
jgi:hypothetical protein